MKSFYALLFCVNAAAVYVSDTEGHTTLPPAFQREGTRSLLATQDDYIEQLQGSWTGSKSVTAFTKVQRLGNKAESGCLQGHDEVLAAFSDSAANISETVATVPVTVDIDGMTITSSYVLPVTQLDNSSVLLLGIDKYRTGFNGTFSGVGRQFANISIARQGSIAPGVACVRWSLTQQQSEVTLQIIEEQNVMVFSNGTLRMSPSQCPSLSSLEPYCEATGSAQAPAPAPIRPQNAPQDRPQTSQQPPARAPQMPPTTLPTTPRPSAPTPVPAPSNASSRNQSNAWDGDWFTYCATADSITTREVPTCLGYLFYGLYYFVQQGLVTSTSDLNTCYNKVATGDNFTPSDAQICFIQLQTLYMRSAALGSARASTLCTDGLTCAVCQWCEKQGNPADNCNPDCFYDSDYPDIVYNFMVYKLTPRSGTSGNQGTGGQPGNTPSAPSVPRAPSVPSVPSSSYTDILNTINQGWQDIINSFGRRRRLLANTVPASTLPPGAYMVTAVTVTKLRCVEGECMTLAN